MAVNMDKAINWFKTKVGKVTYSMSGSRNGSDGTGDCSGMVVTALYNGGASKPSWLYNTDSMHDYLIANGFQLVAFNKSWNMQKGDVIITGLKGQSGGASGHTAIAVDGNNIIDCAWYGSTAVNAVRIHSETDMPYHVGFYVYRLKNGGNTTAAKPKPETSKPSVNDSIKWYDEKGTFTSKFKIGLMTEPNEKSKAIAQMPAGSVIKYDKFCHANGYLWIRQPRGNGKFAYMATGKSDGKQRIKDANGNLYWGTFK